MYEQAVRSESNLPPEEPAGNWGFKHDLKGKVQPFAELFLQGAVSLSSARAYYEDEAALPGFWNEVFLFLAIRRKQIHRAKEMVKGGR